MKKAFGLIIRRVNCEEPDVPSNLNTCTAVTVRSVHRFPAFLSQSSKLLFHRLLIDQAYMGAVIGKLGNRLRQIEEDSGAKLKSTDKSPLPDSPEVCPPPPPLPPISSVC